MSTTKNIYDIFRGVQEKRKECYDNRSAAFIVEGKLSQIVYHIRLEKEISAALVFGHKEGPDDIIVYSLLEDDLVKSDYFSWNSLNFLVYEEERLTDKDVVYRKQKALECNVSFSFNNSTYVGYFKSALRGSEDPDFLGKNVLVPAETPLLVLPTNSSIEIQSEFIIEGKPFKVVEYDHITNKGITYYYLERGIKKQVVATDDEFIEEIETVNEAGIVEQDSESIEELTLKAMVEYEFSTQGAVFAATPAVEVLSRGLSRIKFRVPFGIDTVAITTKVAGENVQKLYKVVL